MVQKKRDVPEKSEIPPDLAATASVPEIEGREIVEAEVGGEGVADVVATKEKAEEEEERAKREAA